MLGTTQNVMPSIQPSMPDADQLNVMPNKARPRNLCQLRQPCRRQTQPRMDALGGKIGAVPCFAAWQQRAEAQRASAHAAAACARSFGSLLSSVLQKDMVPT